MRIPSIRFSISVWRVSALVFLVFGVSLSARGQLGAKVPNWTPAAHPAASSSPSVGLHTMDDVTNALPFIGVTPCRIVDTRQASGPYGGPAISPGSPRSFALLAGPCTGLPNAVAAYSLNITAVNPSGTGFVKVYPEGGSSPVVSTLNFVAGETVANAAIIAAGSGGGITVAAAATTNILIDINGYFSNGSSTLLLNPGERSEIAGSNDNVAIVAGRNDSDASGVVALSGVAGGVDGPNTGVQGISNGTAGDSAGVKGIDASGSAGAPSFETSGARGESKEFIGVLGISRFTGVIGVLTDSASDLEAEGLLGDRQGPNQYGVYSFGDTGVTGAKSFVEPHPTDATKIIRYVSLEGPESGTYFRGSAQTENKQAVIDVPESFRMVSDSEGLTVQVTPIGDLAIMAVVSKDLDHIVVRSSQDVAFDYLVHGVRRAFKNFQPISVGQEFMPRSATEKMPAYLTDEARQRLIANGTYNADGTVNMATAERSGWTRVWADRKAAAQAAAARNASAGKAAQQAQQGGPPQ